MKALEIGGPTPFFAPLYLLYETTHINWARNTIWREHTGMIAEATDLPVPSRSYDLVLSSNVLEHVANPLVALVESRRVLRDAGQMILCLPNQRFNFDHRRPVTTFAHLSEDAMCGMGEDDLTHLPEILALHDLSRDPKAGTPAMFEARSRDNATIRALHHHVFDAPLIERCLDWAGFREVEVSERGEDFVARARK